MHAECKRPSKAAENGAVRKHDQISTTDEPDRASLYFNDDGNKVTDVEYVGSRAPDTDPDDRKADAVVRGRALAENKQTELVIKNEDGKIAGKDSHGKDPRRSKG